MLPGWRITTAANSPSSVAFPHQFLVGNSDFFLDQGGLFDGCIIPVVLRCKSLHEICELIHFPFDLRELSFQGVP